MRILYIAEIVGKAGVFAYKTALPKLKKEYPHDFLIVCADGATGGNGLGRTHAAYIKKLGCNAITLGECCFYKKDLTENLEKIPYVLRPENLNVGAPGIGVKIFNTGNDKIAIIVLLGQNALHRLNADNPFTILPPLLEKINKQTKNIIIDFHAQATAEKKAMFYMTDELALSNKGASAIIGSHARVQTADEAILKNGTACITDAGRTGCVQSVGGCDTASRINEFISGIPDWTKESWEEIEVQGVYLDIDKDGKAKSIERIKKGLIND